MLCKFLQDKRVKVSLFLQDGIQNLDGTIVVKRDGPVPSGSEVPGAVRYFGADGARTGADSFSLLAASGATPAVVGNPGDAKRHCTLGSNM